MLRFLRKSAPIDIFESISTDDHRALARVSDIVEGKLSYPRQNGLAVALRELGALSARCSYWIGCKAGAGAAACRPDSTRAKARNALARAVFFNRLGEIRRPQSSEQQRYLGQRPQSGNGGHRALEHGLSGNGQPML